MRKCLYIFVLLFSLHGITYAAGKIQKVKAIHLKGLVLLNNNDIIGNVHKQVQGDFILIDVDSLHTQLRMNSYIEQYSVNVANSIMMISVTEKKVGYIVAMIKRETTYLLELDNNFLVLSTNNVRDKQKPVVFFDEKYFRGVSLNEQARDFLLMIDHIRKNRTDLYQAISDIYYNGNNIQLYLHNRETTFILKAVTSDFDRLYFIAGYLDRINYYPDKLNINGNKIVIH